MPAGRVNGEKYGEINRPVLAEKVSEAYRSARELGLHRLDFRYKSLAGFLNETEEPGLSVFQD